MSTRPQIKPHQVITNGDMSGSITSQVTVLSNVSIVNYAYIWSGASPSGTITVQVSNDVALDSQGNVQNAGTWNTLPLSNTPTISGNTGNGAIDIDLIGSYAIRTVYNFISGTGTLQAYVVGKVS